MNEIIDFLNANRNGAFATIDNGRPRVRPWGFMMVEDRKFYFCTSNKKDVYKQMQLNPNVEFTATSEDMVTVRLSGKAIFSDDLCMKEKVFDSDEDLKYVYESYSNPAFEIFYIESGEAILSDFSENPPKVIRF